MARNDGRVPYGMVASQIADAKKTCPSIAISRDQINNMLRRRKKRRLKALIDLRINFSIPTQAKAKVNAAQAAPPHNATTSASAATTHLTSRFQMML